MGANRTLTYTEAVNEMLEELSDEQIMRYLSVGAYHARVGELEEIEARLDELEFQMMARIERQDFAGIAELSAEAEIASAILADVKAALENLHDKLKEMGWLS